MRMYISAIVQSYYLMPRNRKDHGKETVVENHRRFLGFFNL